MKPKERILHWQNVFVIMFAIAVVCIALVMGQNEATKIAGSYQIEQLNPWTLTDDSGTSQGVELPESYKIRRDKTFVMETTLPDTIPDNYGIMLRSGYCAIEVSVDGTLLNSYATSLPLPFGRMTGNIRVITEIPSEYAGKTLTIRQTSYYTADSTITNIFYGDVSALKLYVVMHNIWRLMVASGLLIIGIVCLVISFVHMGKKSTENNWSFYHFGCLMFYICCWYVCSSDLPQLVTNANAVASLCSFLSLSLMPIHVAAFSEEVIPDPHDIFRYMQIVEWFNPLLILFGYVANLWDPEEILIFTHIAMVVTVVYSIITGFYYRKRSKSAKNIAIANLILILFLASSLIAYYIAPTSGMDAVVIGIGLAIYTAYLFATFTAREAQLVAESRTKDIYRNLAYHDMLTGLKNRGAYDAQVDEIEKMDAPVQVDLIMMDLNYLKVTNDKYGHLAGDRLIVGAAQCIENIFLELGECYRMGGDEFAIVLLDQHDRVPEYLARFEEEIKRFNQEEKEIPLSVSYGTAGALSNQETGLLQKLFSAADKAMYEDKQRKHKERK